MKQNKEKLQKNKAQEEAIATTEGPVIIISCPGSGKTTTLVRRIENIIKKGANPNKILMVTFSKASSLDMENKYIEMFGKNPGIKFSTIHSLCLTILSQAGLYTYKDIMSDRDKVEFFLKKVYDLPKMTDNMTLVKSIMSEISYIKNNHINYKSKNFKIQGIDKDVFIKIYQEYEQEKKSIGKIDFDDMLFECEKLLTDNPDILHQWQERFNYIQCDEYQDTNLCQKNILYALAANNNNLCVVGDDDQSIYGFRGADFEIMLNFPKDFPEAKVISMSTNYRSGQAIIDNADKLIKHNNNRFQKDFKSFRGDSNDFKGEVSLHDFESEPEMSRAIANEIAKLHKEGTDYKDIAILFRNNSQSFMPVMALLREEIPIRTVENIKTIYHTSIYDDIKSYAELAMGIDVNKNLMNVINRPNRFLKKAAFSKVEEFTYPNMIECIEYLLTKSAWQYGSAEESIKKWFKYLGPKKVTKDMDPTEFLDNLFSNKKIAYLKYIEELSEFTNTPIEENQAIIEELYKDASEFDTLQKWLDHAEKIREKIRQINRDTKAKEGVSLMTMHKSKGLEFKVVFVIGVNEGILPSPRVESGREIEEERRLLYVAITRAKDRLYICSFKTPSRFINEIIAEPKKIDISKKLKGTPVEHVEFGKGKVVKYDKKKIVVNFQRHGIKRLDFPEVMEKEKMIYLK